MKKQLKSLIRRFGNVKSKIKQIFLQLKKENIKEFIYEIKWIYHYSLNYKGAIIWYIFLGVFSTGMGLGSGIVSKYIIDAVTGYNHQMIIPAAAAYLGMQVFQILSNACTTRISAKIQIKVTQEIRADIFNKVMSADWEKMSVYHSGDLLNRVNGDVTTVAGSVIGWIPNLITSLIQFIATLAVILYYDRVLALLSMLSAPISMLASKMILMKMRGYNSKMREVSSELMSFNEETFQNIQYIKSFGQVKQYNEKFNHVQERYRTVQLDFNKFSIFSSSFMSFVGMGVSSVSFGWGIYRLWSGMITYGTMTLFLQMAGNLSGAFNGLINLVPNVISGAVSARRVIAITELPKEDDSEVELAEKFADKYSQNGVLVKARQVDFHYQNGAKVLKNISFEAKPNEVIAFVGASGEGKTTVMRILLGLIQIKAGQVKIYNSEETEAINISPSTRGLFAYVPQGNTIFSGTIAENIRLMNQTASEEEIWEALKDACADTFVKKLPEGIHSRLGERGIGLSEGQVQRLSIARALISNAPILLMDEATSALDMGTEKKVIQKLLKSGRNKTCILTTHRMSILASCSQVYRIEQYKMERLSKKEISQLV